MANPSFAKPDHPYPYEQFLKLVNDLPNTGPFSSAQGRLLEICQGDWHQATVYMESIEWKSKGTTKEMRPTKALVKALEILLHDINYKPDKHLNTVVSIVNAIEEFLKGPFYPKLLRLTTLSAYSGLGCLHSALAALTHRSWQQLGYEGLKHYAERLQSLFKGRTTIASKGEDEDHINKIEDFVFDFRKYCAEHLGTIWKRLWNLYAAPFERLWKYKVEDIEAEERAQPPRAAKSHSLSRSRFRPLSRASLSSTTYGQTAL